MTLSLIVDTSTFDTRALLSWESVTNAAEYRVSHQRDGQASYTEAGITTSTEFETSDLTPNSDHEGGHSFRVEALDSSGSVLETDTVSGTLQTVSLDGPYTLAMRLNGRLGHLSGDDYRSVMATLKPTTQSQWEFETDYLPRLEDWAFSEVFLYGQRQDGGFALLMRGRLDQVRSDSDRNTTTVRGRDVIAKLTTGSTIESYSSIPTHEAIQDYVDNHLPNWSWRVDAQDPEQIASNELALSASSSSEWSDLLTLPDTLPVKIQNDRPGLLQSCFTLDSPQDESASDTGAFNNNEFYSDGQASSLNSTNTFVEWTFTNDYRIPESEVEVDVRLQGSATSPAHTWSLDGTEFLTVPEDGVNEDLGWRNLTGTGLGSTEWSNGDIEPGTHTLRVDFDSGTGDLYVDVVAPNDGRYNYFFDDDNGGNDGYLDGPEAMPDAVNIETSVADKVYNISHAALTSSWKDGNVAGEQAVAVSNTDGDSYDAAASNSTDVESDFSTYGTLAKARFTLSRYGSRTDQTPQQGFKGQAVESFELRLDGNSLSFLDDFQCSSSDYQNLQQLHNRAGYEFTAKYREQALEAHSFPRGSVLDDTDWAVINTSRDLDTSSYYNAVEVRGEGWSPDDPNPSAYYQDDDEVSTHPEGVVEARPVKDVDLSTEADCKSRARELVAEGTGEDELTGSQRVYSQVAQPGYDDLVPEWNNQRVTREKIVFSESQGDAVGTVHYQADPGLVGPLTDVASGLDSVRDTL